MYAGMYDPPCANANYYTPNPPLYDTHMDYDAEIDAAYRRLEAAINRLDGRLLH